MRLKAGKRCVFYLGNKYCVPYSFIKDVVLRHKTKSGVETTFSETLDKNGSLEIGLKLLRTRGQGLVSLKGVGPQHV